MRGIKENNIRDSCRIVSIQVECGGHTKRKQKLQVPFTIKLCSDKAAFEASPLGNASLKMEDARKLLEGTGCHRIVVFTPHIMILRCRSAEVTLSKDGRMLIKRVKDEKEATLVAHDVFGVISAAVN